MCSSTPIAFTPAVRSPILISSSARVLTGGPALDTRHRHLSLYTDLSRMVRERGLLCRRYAYYWSRMTMAVTAFVAVWVAFFVIGNSWGCGPVTRSHARSPLSSAADRSN